MLRVEITWFATGFVVIRERSVTAFDLGKCTHREPEGRLREFDLGNSILNYPSLIKWRCQVASWIHESGVHGRNLAWEHTFGINDHVYIFLDYGIEWKDLRNKCSYKKEYVHGLRPEACQNSKVWKMRRIQQGGENEFPST